MQYAHLHSYESCGTVDGPGLRFVIFLQGCPLRCLYCHNPDSWKFNSGKKVTVDEVFQELVKYKSYMKFSQGGVTISGGEPLYQSDFVKELFTICKENQIHTAVDTSGYINYDEVGKTLDVTDLILLDLKAVDNELHQNLTSTSNQKILRFAQNASANKRKIWIRHVLVPGLTDTDENLHKLGKFVSSLASVEVVEILPFHQMGKYKWEEMGLKYKLSDLKSPSRRSIENAIQILSGYGLNVKY
jgi:pyruvate formate lyase activating enzyme